MPQVKNRCCARLSRSTLTLTTVLGLFMSGLASAQFGFEDRTDFAGIDYTGESYGSSWGDLNADGLPDIYVNHHREKPSLFVNNGDGTFTDIIKVFDDVLIWREKPFLDQHGAAWGDFNKDGFQDLFQSLGAADTNQFMVNFNGSLVEQAALYNIEYRIWPGRLPMWMDVDINGTLDFTVMQRGRPRILTQSGNGSFSDVTIPVGAFCDDNQWGHLADVNGDGRIDLLCSGESTWPNKIYDMTTVPFENITSALPSTSAVTDSITGDFNGDLKTDFFVVRGTLRPSDAAITASNEIQAHLVTDSSRQETIRFQTSGTLMVYLSWSARNRNRIKIGASGFNPTGFTGDEPINFMLDPANPSTHGIMSNNPSVDEGMYIGYDPATETWTINVSPGSTWTYTYWILTSTAPVANLVLTGPGGAEDGLEPALMMSGPGGYTNQRVAAGFTSKLNCAGAVPGDFDNDMDLDIYLICRDGVTNTANLLFENQGDGTFIEVPGAAGAQGPIGFNLGNGESATTADYDLDGFLDLYLTNGLNLYPEPPASLGGSDVLLRNTGNANSWVQLELLGLTSNAPAVGARVLATAGGVTQMREQNGGYHRWSQDLQRLHFGLGTNSAVDIEVRWPNGVTETYTGLAANKIYRVTEGSGVEELVLSSGPPRTLSVDDVSVSEIDGNARFTVSLTGGGSDDVTVDYTTVDDTATNPDDYMLMSGSLIFTAGQTQQIIDIPVFDDVDEEGTEVFRLQLSNANNASLAKSVGIGTILVNDVALCGTPIYDPSVAAVLLYEDCSGGTWTLRTTGGGNFTINSGSIVSSAPLVVTPFSVEGHDIFDVSDPNALTFTFKVWGTGEDGADFLVDVGSTTCVSLAPGSTATAILVGPSKIPATPPFNLATLGPCVDTNPDPDPDPTAGQPTYSPSAQAGFFLWKTGDDNWTIRSSAGGDFAQWTGSLSVGAPFTGPVDQFSIEGHDTVIINQTADSARIDFDLKIWGNSEDGLGFTFPAGSGACLDFVAPVGVAVTVGAGNAQVFPPFNIETLEACVP
jgi:hypothetical protein